MERIRGFVLSILFNTAVMFLTIPEENDNREEQRSMIVSNSATQNVNFLPTELERSEMNHARKKGRYCERTKE